MTMRISVAAAVNNLEILESCLARSPDIVSGRCSLAIHQGYPSAAVALNAGIDGSNSDVVVLAHQDVYLPSGWIDRLQQQITRLEEQDPNWAIIGMIGLNLRGVLTGRIWSSGLNRELYNIDGPFEEAISIDECVIIVRRGAGIRFDEQLPSWHLYATDIILQARGQGLKAFVLNAPVVHNSRRTPTLFGGYAKAYRYMRKKWSSSLPVPTLVAPITRSPFPLLRSQMRRFKVRVLERENEPGLDPVKIARKLAYE